MQRVKVLEHFEFSADEEVEIIVNSDLIQVVKENQFMIGGQWFTCADANPFFEEKPKRKRKKQQESLIVLDD